MSELFDKIYEKTEFFEEEPGTCCFCGDYCNPCSQSCGSCNRSQIWKLRTKSIVVFHKKKYTPNQFRRLIKINKYDFDKPLFLNPETCELSLLVGWAGAILE